MTNFRFIGTDTLEAIKPDNTTVSTDVLNLLFYSHNPVFCRCKYERDEKGREKFLYSIPGSYSVADQVKLFDDELCEKLLFSIMYVLNVMYKYKLRVGNLSIDETRIFYANNEFTYVYLPVVEGNGYFSKEGLVKLFRCLSPVSMLAKSLHEDLKFADPDKCVGVLACYANKLHLEKRAREKKAAVENTRPADIPVANIAPQAPAQNYEEYSETTLLSEDNSEQYIAEEINNPIQPSAAPAYQQSDNNEYGETTYLSESEAQQYAMPESAAPVYQPSTDFDAAPSQPEQSYQEYGETTYIDEQAAQQYSAPNTSEASAQQTDTPASEQQVGEEYSETTFLDVEEIQQFVMSDPVPQVHQPTVDFTPTPVQEDYNSYGETTFLSESEAQKYANPEPVATEEEINEVKPLMQDYGSYEVDSVQEEVKEVTPLMQGYESSYGETTLLNESEAQRYTEPEAMSMSANISEVTPLMQDSGIYEPTPMQEEVKEVTPLMQGYESSYGETTLLNESEAQRYTEPEAMSMSSNVNNVAPARQDNSAYGETTLLNQGDMQDLIISSASPIVSEAPTAPAPYIPSEPQQPAPMPYMPSEPEQPSGYSGYGETTLLSEQQAAEYNQYAAPSANQVQPNTSSYIDDDDDGESQTTLLTPEDFNTYYGGSRPIRNKKLVLIRSNGEKIQFNGNSMRLGKSSSGVDYRINNPSVSRHHATLYNRNGLFYITDNHSTNGTTLEGVMLEPGRMIQLYDGAILGMGNEILQVSITE